MIKDLQRMMEDNDVFIQIFPNERGITLSICDSQTEGYDSFELSNDKDFMQQVREILKQY